MASAAWSFHGRLSLLCGEADETQRSGYIEHRGTLSEEIIRLRKQVLRAGVVALAGVLYVAVLCVPVSHTFAEGRALTGQRSKLDVVLLFDASGSMLATDPDKLRHQGVRLLVSFLGEGDRLGVVRFAEGAKVVQELEPFVPVSADVVVERIRSVPAEGVFTDITQGVQVGAEMLLKNQRPEAERVVVLLSDGKFEPDPSGGPAVARTLQLVQETLPELKAKEVRVFTVALSEQADRPLLGEIAAATDGLTWYAKTADDLHKIFSELFLALKRPQVVAQKGRGFAIDDDVEEATFYINHPPDAVLSLISPKTEVLTHEKHPEYVTWFAGQNFDVITVKEPDLGEWGVAGSVAEDGFATVLTALKLLTDWPLIVRAGDEPLVQARLYEESKPVALPEMSGVVKFGFQIVATDKVSKPVVQEALNDDGSRGDVVALDGIFSSRTGPLEAGAYKLTVVAKGPTFQRSQQIPFTVRARLVTLSVKNPGGAFAEETTSHPESESGMPTESDKDATPSRGDVQHVGGEDAVFTVTISREALALKAFSISLVALSEDRQVRELSLKRLSPTSREYVATASALPKNGRYKVKAILKGSSSKGDQIEGESPVISLHFTRHTAPPPETKESEHHTHHSDEEAKALSGEPTLPIIQLLVVSVLNALGFLVALQMFKRRRKTASVSQQRYLPPAQLLESIELLEGRAASTTVSPEDPIFKVVESMGAEEPIELPVDSVDAQALEATEEAG